jgi:DNA repair protein RecO (recombination protein O)
MEWRDEGILLSLRAHGETSAAAEVFTALHGRYCGIVPGGASRKRAASLQSGAQIDLVWRARLADHMGTLRVELLRDRAATAMTDKFALLALSSICALCRYALPERAAYPVLYAATCDLLDSLGQPGWLRTYALWEVLLLEETGFGLDLTQCAVTGKSEDLAYVSPRTGRAVTRDGAGIYAARLLPLPGLLIDDMALADAAALYSALSLTGHFLHDWLAASIGRPIPEARARLVSALHPPTTTHQILPD